MKKLDWYLIRKFLGTFVYAMFLIILIVIMFDISERIGRFISSEAPLRAIIFDYYLNFIPFFVNMFSALFTFIAVVFFTSRMAANSEIVAILSSGISFKRMLVPYLLCAVFIGIVNVYLASDMIPRVNRTRIAFQKEFIWNRTFTADRNIHIQYNDTTFFYVESFNVPNNIGYRFTKEIICPEQGMLRKLSAESARFDTSTNLWRLGNYHIRVLDTLGEFIQHGHEKFLELGLVPTDFFRTREDVYTMTNRELRAFIERERLRGSDRVRELTYDYMVRFSHPFAALVLALIAVSISSRKSRGGTGLHLAFGLMIAFLFIFFLQLARAFATQGSMPVWIAAWLPIFIFGFVALVLLRLAPK